MRLGKRGVSEEENCVKAAGRKGMMWKCKVKREETTEAEALEGPAKPDKWSINEIK